MSHAAAAALSTIHQDENLKFWNDPGSWCDEGPETHHERQFNSRIPIDVSKWMSQDVSCASMTEGLGLERSSKTLETEIRLKMARKVWTLLRPLCVPDFLLSVVQLVMAKIGSRGEFTLYTEKRGK